MSVCGHVGENNCLTVLLFDGLSVHPFVCSYTVCVCFCPSVCLPVRTLSVYVSVRACVRPSACMHIFVILFVTLLVCMFSFRSFVRPNVRLSVLSSSVRMIMHACKSVVYKHVCDIPYF